MKNVDSIFGCKGVQVICCKAVLSLGYKTNITSPKDTIIPCLTYAVEYVTTFQPPQ